LRAEFTSTRNINDGAGTFAQKPAADDYLHQAADPNLWPDDINYDPDGTGIYITSLGTHEHWNNPVDKQYSRNLGLNTGIELLKVSDNVNVGIDPYQLAGYNLDQNYPNPFSSSTNITYSVPVNSQVVIKVYDVAGREIKTIENSFKTAGSYTIVFDGNQLPAGEYFYRLTANAYSSTKKIVILK
jgi:hypothetical protein